MNKYRPQDIEPKWQKNWADTQVYAAKDDDTSRAKYYMLTEFPYPSGDGLHAGHAREYTLGDVVARHKRMQGYNVLYPMGYDAFGLPTENYAIKHKIKPQDATAQNVANFRKQFDALGYSFDWTREVNTTDPSYYKWTQWLFLRFLEAGLAYQAEMPINWCPKEKTGLANEEVVDGKHERCGTPVEKKLLKQWMLGITQYADRLIEGLKTVDYPPRIADQQINWIGRSEGAEIEFEAGEPIKTADSLKFTPELTHLIQIGEKTSTIRLEAKKLKAGDHAKLITRFNKDETQAFAVATITRVRTLALKDIPLDLAGHEPMHSHEQKLADYRRYYSADVTMDTEFTIYDFKVVKPIVTVYTTRPDTIAGATFLVLAPEHPAVAALTVNKQQAAVKKYVKQAGAETDLDRQAEERPKTGVFTGAYAKNPITGEPMPIWVADYVLASYGTGAIMAVPAHDERDFGFAKAHDLSIKPVIQVPPVKTALILHGTDGHNQKAWVPWLKAQLEDFGYEVIAPNLPNASHPDLEAWLKALAPYADKLNEQSVIIGHSLGAPTAEQFILNHKLNIDKLLLVAPTFPDMPWPEYFKKYPEANTQNIHDVSTVPVDWAKLRKSVGQIIVFGSQDDPYIPFGALAEHIKENLAKATFKRFDARGHFGAEVKTLPEAPNYLITEITTTEGPLINSGQFDGLAGTEAKHAIVEHLYKQGIARGATKYRLRDWIFSRQHYWGEPIPVVHCPKCGAVPVPDDQLPVTLPDVDHYEPTDDGRSPLASIDNWVNVNCPKCGGPAQRETDTMPNWAGSSWYWLRYMDARNAATFADPAKLKYWGAVDLYLGGMEHTTLHLLYSRFWHQFLYDQKLVPTPEPYAARRGQGIVLAADGRKMSKSLGNVINPMDIIERYGADAFRLYIMFMAPYDETTPWSDERLGGTSRFLYRVWTLAQELIDPTVTLPGSVGYELDLGAFATEVDRTTHKTLKKVHHDYEDMRFNTAVSALMEYLNFLASADTKRRLLQANARDLRARTLRTLILILAPAAPHLTEELWHQLGEEGSVHVASWPQYDAQLIRDDVVTIVVQINGKVRGQLAAAADATETEITAAAQTDPKVAAHLKGKTIVKTIMVPRKLVNFVVK